MKIYEKFDELAKYMKYNYEIYDLWEAWN